MPDLTDRLTEIYSPAVAASSATILDIIYSGDLDAARRRIDALGIEADAPLARTHMLSLLHLADAEFAKAEQSMSLCVDQRPDIFLAEYCELMLDLDRQSKATEKLDQLAQQGKTILVLDAITALMDSGSAWACLWKQRVKILDALGRHEDALRVSLECEDERLLAIADSLSKSGPKPVSPALEPDLCRILGCEKVYLPGLSGVISETLAQRINGWSRDDSSLEQIDRDELLHSALRAFEFRHVDVEQFVTGLRKRILLATLEPTDGPILYWRLILSIAAQCRKNEYVYYADPSELHFLDDVRREVADCLSRNRRLSARLAVLASLLLMYRSPAELGDWGRSLGDACKSLHPAMYEFLAAAIGEHEAEMALAAKFAGQTALKDAMSIDVAGMYEENPYPRWSGGAANINPDRLDFVGCYRLDECPAWDRSSPRDVESILVAGCGTGQHPISIAASFPDAHVTAIDISCRSLAYGQRMAEKLGIDNITFRRQDILQLPEWQCEFDLVDAVGVIHHMRDPDVGLKALLTRLRSRGLLRLGLYSSHARQFIANFRATIADSASSVSADDIRAIRHRIISSDDPGRLELLKSQDFYSVSGFRDLLLHVQEIQYTIPEFTHLLANNRLSFLKFLDGNHLYQNMRILMGHDADEYDLQTWHAAELKAAPLFARMYIFFAQRQF